MTSNSPHITHRPPGRDLAVISRPGAAHPSPATAQTASVAVTIASTPEPHGFWAITKDWQGLEAGGLAILAAVIGAVVLNKQTRTNLDLEANRRERKLRAMRAVLPLTLSSLISWADESGHALLQAYGQGKHATRLPPMPTVPADAIPNLQELVEAGSDENAESISNLLGDIQIFTARVQRPGAGRLTIDSDLESHLLGIGAIAAHIAAMFDFSRRRSDATPDRPTWDQVRTALKLMGADESLQPDLFKRLDGRESAGKRPGYLAMQD